MDGKTLSATVNEGNNMTLLCNITYPMHGAGGGGPQTL